MDYCPFSYGEWYLDEFFRVQYLSAFCYAFFDSFNWRLL